MRNVGIGLFLNLLFSLAFFSCDAATYTHFYFKPNNKLILKSGNTIAVEFFYSILGEKESSFYVIPQSDNGIISIFNESTGVWVYSSQNLTQMPTLSKRQTMRIQNMTKNHTEVKFKLIRKKTGESWETTPVTFWSVNIFDDYIPRLNEGMQ